MWKESNKRKCKKCKKMIFQCASLHARRKAMWRFIVLPDVLSHNLALKGYRPPDREAIATTLKVQAPAPLLHSFAAAISEDFIFQRKLTITKFFSLKQAVT
jgi:hypothetical protein